MGLPFIPRLPLFLAIGPFESLVVPAGFSSGTLSFFGGARPDRRSGKRCHVRARVGGRPACSKIEGGVQ